MPAELVKSPAEPRLFQRIILDAMFVISLISVHLEGSYLVFARIGWTLQAILFVLDTRYALFAAFFHSAFFNPAGFLSNSFFTIKHLHISVALLAVVRVLKGELGGDIYRAVRNLKTFFPIFAILGIGLVNYLYYRTELKALLIPGNFAIVIGMMLYLVSVFLFFEPAERLKNIEASLKYFLFGVLLQTFVSYFPDTVTLLPLWKTTVIHNNHLGMLTTIALWFALYFFGRPSSRISMIVAFVSVVFLFGILLATCCRTAWISFLIVIPFWIKGVLRSGVCGRGIRAAPLLAAILVGITVGLCFSNEYVRARVIKMPQILDPGYWQYTIQDRQNFGFLGIFRLRDLQEVRDILSIHPLQGIGFVSRVVDIHGFYFLLLAGTGAAGFICFLAFLGRTLNALWISAGSKATCREGTLSLVCLCAILSWAFGLLMESYFLQFFVWIPVLTAIVVLQTPVSREGASGGCSVNLQGRPGLNSSRE